MSAIEMRRQAKRLITSLPEEELRSVLNYLQFLDYRREEEEEDATEELERIPGFAQAMREAERDIAAGRLTPVEKIVRQGRSRLT